MSRTKQRILSWILSITLIVSIIGANTSGFYSLFKQKVNADSNYNNFANYVTNVDVTTDTSQSASENLNTNDGAALMDGDSIAVVIDYVFPANTITGNTASELTFTYQLPIDNLDFTNVSESALTGTVYSSNDAFANGAGTYTIDPNTGIVTFEFIPDFWSYNTGNLTSSNVATQAQNLTGTFRFTCEASTGETATETTFSFPGAGASYEFTVVPDSTAYSTSSTKTSVVDEANKTVTYTITVSGDATNGTRGAVSITDNIYDYYNNNSVNVQTLDPSSIVAKNAAGETVSFTSLSTTDTNFVGTLPKLDGGDYYTITYTVNYDDSGINGTVYMGNYANVHSEDEDGNYTSSDNSSPNYNAVGVTHEVADKYAVTDDSTYIDYTIYINEAGENLAGYTVSDVFKLEDETFDSSAVSNFTVTATNTTSNTTATSFTSDDAAAFFGSGFTFPSTAADYNTYTITYRYNLPEETSESLTYENTVTVTDGNDYFTDGTYTTIGATDYETKTLAESTGVAYKDTNDNILGYAYNWTLEVSNTKASTIAAGSYTIDTLDNSVVTQYITGEINASYTGSNTETGSVTVIYYDKDGNALTSVPTATNPAYSFRVTYPELVTGDAWTLTYSSVVPIDSLEYSNYNYTVTNTSQYHKDSTTVEDAEVVSGTATKFSKITKTGRSFYGGTVDGTANYAWVDGSEYAPTSFTYNSNNDYTSRLYYRLEVAADDTQTGVYTVTDTLPTGTTLGSLSYSVGWGTETAMAQAESTTAVYYAYDSDTNVVTFYVPEESGVKYNSVFIYYNVILPEEQDTAGNYTFTNSASDSDNTVNLTYEVTYDGGTDEKEVISEKWCTDVENNGVLDFSGSSSGQPNVRTIQYAVIVNKEGADADGNSLTDAITLTDTLSMDKTYIKGISLNSIALYEYDSTAATNNYCGAEVSEDMISHSATGSINGNNYQMELSVELPDEHAYVLLYSYTFTFNQDKYSGTTISNSVDLSGHSASQSSSISYKLSSSSATVAAYPKISMYKVASDNFDLKLEGAKFTISKYDVTNNDWSEITSNLEIGTTGIYLQGAENTSEVYDETTRTLTLNAFTIYKLTETQAPSGYTASSSNYYIVLGDKDTTDIGTLQNAVASTISAAQGAGKLTGTDAAAIRYYIIDSELDIPNDADTSSITLQKNFVDVNGDAVEDDSLSATVELYKAPVSSTDAITVRLIFANNNYINWGGESNLVTLGTYEVKSGAAFTANLTYYQGTVYQDSFWQVGDPRESTDNRTAITGSTATTISYTPTADTDIYVCFDSYSGASNVKVSSVNATAPTYTIGTASKVTSADGITYNNAACDGTITLNADNGYSVVLNGTSEDYYYYIKETSPSSGYTTTYKVVNANGSTYENSAAGSNYVLSGGSVIVTNQAGEEKTTLTLNKTITGDVPSGVSKTFVYNLTMWDEDGNLLSGNRTFGNAYTFVNGVTQINVTAGTAVTLTNIPVGYSYTLTESTENDKWPDTHYSYVSGNVTTETTFTSDAEAVTITNQYTPDNDGSIVITKNFVAKSCNTRTFYFGLFSDEAGTTPVTDANDNPLVTSITLTGDATNGIVSDTASFTGLAYATYYVFETDENGTVIDSDLALEYTIDDKDGIEATVSYEDKEAAVSFTNNEKVFSIILAKNIVDEDDNAVTEVSEGVSKTFTMLVYLYDNKGNAVSGTYGGLNFANGVASVEVTAGTYKHINNLPVGFTYKVYEDTSDSVFDSDHYTYKSGNITTKTGAIINATGDTTSVMHRIYNTYVDNGEITVNKNYSSYNTESATFYFALFSDAEGTTRAQINGTDIPVGSVELSGNANTGVSGGTVSFEELPYGTYYVFETDASGNVLTNSDSLAYTISDTDGKEVVLSVDDTAEEVTFTNTEKVEGEITVSKTYTSSEATEKTFYFALFDDANGTERSYVDGSTTALISVKSLTIATTADALTKTDTVVFDGLNPEKTYYVFETDSNGSVLASTPAMTIEYTGDDGQVAALTRQNPEVTVAVSNTELWGSLTLSKVITGTVPSGTGKTFPFVVTLKDANNQPVSGTYGGYTFDTNGQVVINVYAGTDVTIGNIPVGLKYTVTEDTTDMPDEHYSYVSGNVTTATAVTEAGATVTITNKYTEDVTGTITVNKTWEAKNPGTETFYFTLFDDANGTVRSKEGNTNLDIKTVELTATATNLSVSDSVEFTGLTVDKTYYVFETDADGNVLESTASMTIDYDSQAVALDSTNNTGVVNITNTELVGDLTLSKAITGTVPTGISKTFSFIVTLTDEDGAAVAGTFGDYTFNANGQATINVTAGTDVVIENIPAGFKYTVTEDTANMPDSHYSYTSGNVTTATAITESGATVTITNKYTSDDGSITVTKNYESDSNTSRTFYFALFDDVDGTTRSERDGTVIPVLEITNMSSENTSDTAAFTGLAYATYYVFETDANGTVIADDAALEYTVEGNDGQSVTLSETNKSGTATFTNTEKSYSLTISKDLVDVYGNAVDASSVPSAVGKSFQVKVTMLDASGEPFEGTIDGNAFDGNGEKLFTITAGNSVVIENIPYGFTYKVEEVESSIGAHFAYKEGNVTTAKGSSLNANGSLTDASETIVNYYYTGLIQVTKNYITTREKSKTFYFALFDDAEGTVRSKGIDGNSTISIKSLELTATENNNYQDSQEFYFENLAIGKTYYVFETDSSGNVLSSSEEMTIYANGLTATCTQSDSTDEVSFTNTDNLGSIQFTKIGYYNESCSEDADATKPLEGVRFEARLISTLDGQDPWSDVIYEATSDANGVVTFEDVEFGVYEVYEEESIDGYVFDTGAPDYFAVVSKSSTTTSLTSDEEGTTPVAGNAIINEPYRTDLTFTKVSESDTTKALEGSTYGLYKEVGGSLVQIATANSDENGVVTFEGVLTNVVYTVKELSAPNGYRVTKNPITIVYVVDVNGKVVIDNSNLDTGDGTIALDESNNIIWLEPEVIVQFNKVDEEGNGLSGATLQVEDEDGNVVYGPFTSTEETLEVAGIFAAGETYKLVETAAPNGYEIADPVEFTISAETVTSEENEPVVVTMTDEKSSEEEEENPEPTPTDEVTPTPTATVTSTPTATPTGGTPSVDIDGGPSPITGDNVSTLFYGLASILSFLGILMLNLKKKEEGQN